MNVTSAGARPAQPGDGTVFKWACLLVAVAALAALGWMLNDVRLEVKALGRKAERLTDRTEALVDRLDKQLPPILAETQTVSKSLSGSLPALLKRTEALLEHSEVAVDNIAEVSDSFKQYKGLMGLVHVATQNKGLFSYATDVLGFLGKHTDASIGVKAPGGDGLRRAVPAKQWAAAAAKDAHFLSLGARTKDDILHGLARTASAAPWHIKIGDAAPRPLADWLKESHPESKGG